MKHNLINLIVVIFVFSYSAIAINVPDYDNIQFDYLTHKNGLTNSPINYIYQDSIGYLWFATKTSLFRYDGSEIKDYTLNNDNQKFPFSTKNVQFITYKNSKLYFTTSYELGIFDTQTNDSQIFYYKDYFNINNTDNLINKCFVDNKNNLWISSHQALFKSIKKEGKITGFKTIILDKNDSTLQSIALYQDKFDNLWVGTMKGVYIYNEKLDSTINLEKSTWQIQPYAVNNIKQDKQGYIWVGQTKRIIKFDKDINIFNVKNPQPSIYFLHSKNSFDYVWDFNFDKNDNIWIVMPYAVKVLEFHKNSTTEHSINFSPSKKNSLSSNNLHCLTIDNQGLVYIGTFDAGVNIYDPYREKVKTSYPKDYYGTFNVDCLCKDYKGNIWMGIDNNKLFYYLTKEKRFIELKFKQDFIIRNIFETKDHNIFFTSMSRNKEFGGLIKINNLHKFNKTHNPKDLSITFFNSNNIKGIDEDMSLGYFSTQDIDGTIWYISIEGGTYHLKYEDKEMKLIKCYSSKNAKKHNLSNIVGERIDILSDSSLFISSTNFKMIKYIRETDKFKNLYDFSNYINPKNVTDFTFSYLDKKGNHWFGTEGGGLLRYNKGDSIHCKIFNQEKGFISNNIYTGIMDNNSHFWLGTASGIAVVDSNDVLYKINKSDGLRNEYMSKYSAVKLNDSTICFGGKGGLNIINTNKIFNYFNNSNSRIGISEIDINGISYNKILKDKKLIDYNNIKELRLDANLNNLNIKISTLSFSNPKENTITYRLLPLQKKWKININANKNIVLNNLKNGKYLLQCKVINSNGKISNISKNLTIIIAKPYYKKIWFIIFIIILIIGLFFLIQFLFRINIVKKNNKLKKLVNKQTEELLKNNKQLEEKTKELSSLNATRTKMFSVIAHDLISPLGTIMGTNNLIVENYKEINENGKLIPFLMSNNDAISSLYELLQNLLFWSRHQQSKIDISPSLFNLYELGTDVFLFLKNTLNKKGNTLDLQIPKDMALYADKQMIHTILRNIISNANKFTDKGKIIVKAQDMKKFTKFSITDTGIGMTKEKAANLFNTENIKSTKGTSGETGTGLGLSVSKDFVLEHKGTISAKSSLGKGTTITFTISKQINN